jgi:hypothetical protein
MKMEQGRDGEGPWKGDAAPRWDWDSAMEESRRRWSRMLRQRWPEVPGRIIESAVREAWSLALLSGVPELVFPLLAEEKGWAVVSWHARQRRILDATASFFPA